MNALFPTVASLDCPTWLRRRWEGERSPIDVVMVFVEWVRRAGGLIWR